MLQFLAQPANLRIDAAVETYGDAASGQIEKLIAIEHALRALDQGYQEIVFAGAERDGDAIVANEFACASVERPAVEMITFGTLA